MKLYLLYFSPTGGVRQVAQKVVQALMEQWESSVSLLEHDFTLPEQREQVPTFTADDVVFLALPVYAGRVPNLILPYLNRLCGNGAKVIPVVVYGNRAYDDALLELSELTSSQGFELYGAAAFVARHAFTDLLGERRPDAEDHLLMKDFAKAIAYKRSAKRYSLKQCVQPLERLKDDFGKSLSYYQPKDEEGNSIDMRKVKPITTEHCSGCGLCVAHCPLGSISTNNPKEVVGKCMKCCSCVRHCPQQAKVFTDLGFIYHRDDLLRCFASQRGACVMYV